MASKREEAAGPLSLWTQRSMVCYCLGDVAVESAALLFRLVAVQAAHARICVGACSVADSGGGADDTLPGRMSALHRCRWQRHVPATTLLIFESRQQPCDQRAHQQRIASLVAVAAVGNPH